jgi:hypothetical protein
MRTNLTYEFKCNKLAGTSSKREIKLELNTTYLKNRIKPSP